MRFCGRMDARERDGAQAIANILLSIDSIHSIGARCSACVAVGLKLYARDAPRACRQCGVRPPPSAARCAPEAVVVVLAGDRLRRLSRCDRATTAGATTRAAAASTSGGSPAASQM